MIERPGHRAAILVLAFAMMSAARAGAVAPLSGEASPRDVIAKLQTAVAERSLRDYAHCLADSFVFVPRLADVAAHPELARRAWDRARELAFAAWLLSPAREAELDLSERLIERGIESRGRAAWEVVYRLGVDGAPFAGRATLVFVEIDQLWYLESWTDTRPEPLDGAAVPTSGEARASSAR